MRKKVLVVIGTRPNIIKITRFKSVASERGRLDVQIVHTGQHYSANMADVFFDQFGIKPDHCLGVAAGSPTRQIADIMIGLEQVLTEQRPDLVVVVGDVNSTLAAAVTANKLGIPIGHLESGLRSFDRSMPEEHNRVVTDRLSDHYFVTEQSGLDNLRAEGARAGSVHFVGNTMIDTLVAYDSQIEASTALEDFGLGEGGHVLMTLHRPATVDSPERLAEVLDLVADITRDRKVVFPLHPRTAKNLVSFGLDSLARSIAGLVFTEPLDYFAFQKLVAKAGVVLTDSGGIQEESTYRQVPCLTLRPNTERPITVSVGSNELVPADMHVVRETIARIDAGQYKKGRIPPLWDGHATERVMETLEKVL